MKALIDRLEWIKLYINGELGNRTDPKQIKFAQDVFIEIYAIADALPELAFKNEAQLLKSESKPIERIIKLHE